MKVQLRDMNDMRLLGEADLEGLTFTVRGDNFVCNQNLHFEITDNGYLMPQALVIDKHGRIARVLDMGLTSQSVGPGTVIDVNDLRWMFGRQP